MPRKLIFFILLLLLTNSSIALTLDEAFDLAKNGPEGIALQAVAKTDISYSLELNSKISSDNLFTSAEIKGLAQIKSLNLSGTVDLKNKNANARFNLPLELINYKAPGKPDTDPLLSLRSRVTNLFFTILESDEQLEAKLLALEIAKEEYDKSKLYFARGTISFKALSQSLEEKQRAENQLQQFINTYKDNKSELVYLLDLVDAEPLTYDYSLTFQLLDDLPLTEKEQYELDYPILAAQFELEQLKKLHFPQLSLEGTGSMGQTNKYYVGLSLRYLVLSSNKNALKRNAQAKLENVKLERNKKERNLTKEKNRLKNDYNHEVLALEAAKLRLKENEEFYELASKAYQDGLISDLDQKRAYFALLQARANYKSTYHKCFKLKLAIEGVTLYQQGNLAITI